MLHKRIQEKLLLYLDGNLPEEEMQHIREHLSTCPVCARQRDMLAPVWRTEDRLKKAEPTPFLWTRLQARINEYEHTPRVVWDVKGMFRGMRLRPIPALAVIAAVTVGIYIGTPHEPQRSERAQSISQLTAAANELGLDQFDVIPPGTLGSTLVDVSGTGK